MNWPLISPEWTSLAIQVAAIIAAFVLGARGTPGRTVRAIALGISADVVGQYIIMGGGPGACVGFVLLPAYCLIATWLGGWLRDRWLDHRRALPGRCPKCNYDLTGNTSGRCPECGLQINPNR